MIYSINGCWFVAEFRDRLRLIFICLQALSHSNVTFKQCAYKHTEIYTHMYIYILYKPFCFKGRHLKALDKWFISNLF